MTADIRTVAHRTVVAYTYSMWETSAVCVKNNNAYESVTVYYAKLPF